MTVSIVVTIIIVIIIIIIINIILNILIIITGWLIQWSSASGKSFFSSSLRLDPLLLASYMGMPISYCLYKSTTSHIEHLSAIVSLHHNNNCHSYLQRCNICQNCSERCQVPSVQARCQGGLIIRFGLKLWMIAEKIWQTHLWVSTAELGTDHFFSSSSNLVHHHSLHAFQHLQQFNFQLLDSWHLMSLIDQHRD